MSTRALPTLRRGSTGNDVKHLQKTLNGLGYGPLAVDGILGPTTEAAVKKFQGNFNLTVDGIVGPRTWTSLQIQSEHDG